MYKMKIHGAVISSDNIRLLQRIQTANFREGLFGVIFKEKR